MSDNQLTVAQPPALLAVASLTGLDQKYLIETIKRQCFKGAADDAQVDAFISIACEMKVNPLLPGMLYAYPISGGGIVPIMGPSGVYKKLVEHPEVDSWETEVFPADVSLPPTHAVTKIYRKGREKPLQYMALLSEWKINSNPNWSSRPRHMLALRSLKHCANQIIHGIPYDEDDRVIMAMQNVTGTVQEEGAGAGQPGEQQKAPERPAPRPRASKGAAAAKEVVAEVVNESAKPVDDVQAALAAREAKLQSQGGDVNATAPERNAAPRAVEVAPQVPSNPAPAATPRTSLNAGEKITVTAKVESCNAGKAQSADGPKPYVKATLSGEYSGEVRDKINAELKDDKAVAKAPWAVGATLSFTLSGVKSTAPEKTPDGKPNPLYGKVLVWVDSIATVEQQETLE